MYKYFVGFCIGIIFSISVTVLAAGFYFPDVPRNAYYYKDVQALAARGVMKGYTDGKFGPNDNVTRGQLSSVLNRYNESFVTYHGVDNYVGILIDIVCKTTSVEQLENDIRDDYEALCKKRGESPVIYFK